MKNPLFITAILFIVLMVFLHLRYGPLPQAERGDYGLAIRRFTQAIDSGELSQEELSIAYYNRGNAWKSKGRWYSKKAAADYKKATDEYRKDSIATITRVIEIDPKNAEAYYNRGNVWYEKGNYNKAIADYTKAIEIDPQYAKAYNKRGLAWQDKGDYDRAIADYTKAIEINPNYAEAYNKLAWLKATCPDGNYRDGARAVECAEKAVGLKEVYYTLGTLAAAYAEAGKFQECDKDSKEGDREAPERRLWDTYDRIQRTPCFL